MDDGNVNITHGSRSSRNSGLNFSTGGITGPGIASAKKIRRRKEARLRQQQAQAQAAQAQAQHEREQQEQQLHEQAVVAQQALRLLNTQRFNDASSALDHAHLTKLAQGEQQLQHELETLPITTAVPPEQAHLYVAIREQQAINELLARKNEELEFLRNRAQAFYADSPLGKPTQAFLDTLDAQGNTEQAFERWHSSYDEALAAQRLEHSIARLLDYRTKADRFKERLIADRLAREAHWEQLRLRGEAAQVQMRARNDAAKTELKVLRQGDEARRERTVNAVLSNQLPAAAVMAGPAVVLGGASAGEVGALLHQAIRNATAELLRTGAQTAGRTVASFVTLMTYSPEAGRGSDVVPTLSDRILHVVMPLDQLHTVDPQHLQSLADAQGSLALPYRLRAEAGDTLTSVYMTDTHDPLIAADVPVRYALWDPQSNTYRITGDGFPASKLTLTMPTAGDTPSSSGMAVPDSIVIGEGAPVVQVLPTGATLDFDDMIAVMPPGSPIPHLYLAGTSRYREPGVVRGQGQNLATGIRELTQQTGSAPIPAQVADQLRWNAYATEADLRADLWRTIAREQPLVASLDDLNLKRMQKGFAPVAPKELWAGTQRTLDIDYVQPPVHRGDGFNLDNLRIAKPGTTVHPRPVSRPFVPWSDSQSDVSKAFAAAHAQKTEATRAQRASQERVRLDAEEKAQLLSDRLAFQQWHKAAHTFSAGITALAEGPTLLAPAGELDLLDNGRQLLTEAFATALAELPQAPSDATTLAMATFASAEASLDADDDQQLAFSAPLEQLFSVNTAELQRLAQAGLGIDLPVRVGAWFDSDSTQLALVSTAQASDSSNVRIRRATLDPLTGVFSAQTDDVPPRYITWTPATPPGGEQLGIPSRPIVPTVISVYSGDTAVPVVPELETLPAADVVIDDYIFLPDSETGVGALYWAFTYLPGDHKYISPPISLPAFPDAMKTKSKTIVQGGGKKRDRWKGKGGTLYEWDSRHGTIEKYSKRGIHLGEFNYLTGEQTKPADPTRRIEP